MHLLNTLALLGLTVGAAVVAAEPKAEQPWESGAWSLESGVLWEVGHNTPIPYRLMPVQLSWRSAEWPGWGFKDGSRLVLRHRLTLLGTMILHGPESHYVGVAGSPSLEWWNKAGTRSVFTGAGGGVGLIDSRGITGGQGEDYTLNWFARGGVEWVTPRGTHLSAGVMFQHMSNGGRTEPNPGIDALGFTVGYSWRK